MIHRINLNIIRPADRRKLVNLILLAIIVVSFQSVSAQLEGIGPISGKFQGPMIWSSIGGFSHNDYQSNVYRGGIAALFGPFYLSKADAIDTTIIYDSTITIRTGKPEPDIIVNPLDTLGFSSVDKIRIRKILLTQVRDKNWEQLNIAVGYVSTFRGGIKASKFKSSAPVNGISIAAFHDVYRTADKNGVEVALGVGAGFFSITNGSGVVNDTTPVVFSTETRIAPSLYCIFSHRFLFTGVNYQFLNFSSINYSPRQGGALPSDKSALPRKLNLNSAHIMLGVRLPKP